MAKLIEVDEIPSGATQKTVKLIPVDDTPSEPFGQRLSRELADIPRQVGLTARAGMKGVGNAVGLLSDPIGALINIATGSKLKPAGQLADSVADSIGLPKPANATERWVGDAAELMVPAAGIAGTASKVAKTATGTTQKVAQTLAANPLQQIVSAGTSGAAGGYTRETGGDGAAQFVASVAGGLAAPYAMNKSKQLADAAVKTAKRITTPANPAAQFANLDITIDNALQSSGLSMADIPANVRNSIRADVQSAMKTGGVLSPDGIRRLADYRLTGATPTAATLTLDPAMVSQQKNLAKLGINSKDAAAQTLGRVENANNAQLIDNLNNVGANTADDTYSGSQKIIGALQARDNAAKAAIGQRYDAARASSGRSAALDPSHFTQTANNLLDESLLGGKLPSDVRNLLNKTATGDMPLTVDVAEQFKTRIGELQRATNDMAERKALGLVRQALDDTPLQAGQDIGQQSIDAFNKARRLNRAWMGIVEKTPALQAVRDGIEPDKFVQQFIVGGGGNANVMDIAMLKNSIKKSPEAMEAVKGQIAAYLKKAALNGAADEVGNFSQSGYNKALNAIGDRKLSMFFAPEDVNRLKAVGRVSSYEQFQPRGAAVNNSNTASAAASVLDRVADSSLLSKIPLGNQIAGPLQNISIGIKANKALDLQRGLLAPQISAPAQTPLGLLLAPAAVVQSDDKKKRKASLLP